MKRVKMSTCIRLGGGRGSEARAESPRTAQLLGENGTLNWNLSAQVYTHVFRFRALLARKSRREREQHWPRLHRKKLNFLVLPGSIINVFSLFFYGLIYSYRDGVCARVCYTVYKTIRQGLLPQGIHKLVKMMFVILGLRDWRAVSGW